MKDKIVKVFAKIKNDILEESEDLKAKYKNSESKAMFILSFILNSRFMIILLGFVLMFKTTLFYKNINYDILPKEFHHLDHLNLLIF